MVHANKKFQSSPRHGFKVSMTEMPVNEWLLYMFEHFILIKQ